MYTIEITTRETGVTTTVEFATRREAKAWMKKEAIANNMQMHCGQAYNNTTELHPLF